MKRIFKFLKFIYPHYKYLVLLAFLTFFGSLSALITPYFGKITIDEALLKKDYRKFLFLVFLTASIFIFSRILDFFQNYLKEVFRQNIKYRLSCKLFIHLHRLDFLKIKEKASTQYLYMFESDVENIASMIVEIFGLINIFFTFLFTVAIIIFFDAKIILLLATIMAILYFIFYFFDKRTQKITAKLISNSETAFKVLEELLLNIILTKLFAKEKESFKKYIKFLKALVDSHKKYTKNLLILSFLNEFNIKIIFGIFFLYGGYQIINGNLTLGTFGAIGVYLYRLFEATGELFNWKQSNSLGLSSYNRINQILEEPVVKEDAKKIQIKGESFSFENVSFSYIDKSIFENINFSVKSKTVALAGPSGCGKTTLLYLLLKLYKPEKGNIFIDGYSLNEISSESLLNQISIAPGEPFLWNATIKENIKYAKEDAKEEEIEKAIEVCGLKSLILSTPEGLNANIGELAFKISSGQKQKISIARALIKNPKILILDEATSSLDLESEHFIISNIKRYYPQTMIIFVSHRPTILKEAELICYFKGKSEIIVDSFENLCKDLEFRKFLNLC